METLQFEYRNGRPVAGSPSATLHGRGRLRQSRGPGRAGRARRRLPHRDPDRGGRLRRDLAGGAGRLLRPPSAGGRSHLHQRCRRHPRRGQPAAGPGGRNPSPEPSHEAQLLRGHCPRTPPRSSRRRQLSRDPAADRSAWSARTCASSTPRRRSTTASSSAGARWMATRSLSPPRKAASWAAPSARCTAPSWSACWSAPSTSGRPPSCCWSNPAACACTRPTPA